MRVVIDLLYLLAVILGSPWLLYKMVRTGKYRKGLRGRLGGVKRREGDKRCLWVHGVSVGEVLAARTLVEGFTHRHPDWDVVISTTTSTGQEVAKRHYPGQQVVYYPVDFGFAVERAMKAVRPDAIVLVEADLWPNFLGEAARRRTPVMVVNNRIGARSFRQQMMLRYLGRLFLYDRLTQVTAQTEVHARRLRELGAGAGRVTVTGSVKYDAAPTRVGGSEELARELGIREGERVIVAGSTFAPEEKILLGIYGRLRERFRGLRLVVVPRRPERFDEVARMITEAGFKVTRRSECVKETEETLTAKAQSAQRTARPGVNSNNSQEEAKGNRKGAKLEGDVVILGDTMGELTRFYGLAEVVFVGKSLVAGGGQNILEPAGLGKAVVFGPSMYNFEEPAQRLLGRGAAVQVRDAKELEKELGGLLASPQRAREMGLAGREAIDAGRGATERNLDMIDKVLAERRLL